MEEYLLEKKYLKEDIENYIDLNQKNNFSKFLQLICQSKKLNIDQQNNILISLREKLLIYLLNNNEYLDEYIIANLVTFQNIQKEIISNFDVLIDFIKLINFIKIFTTNINMTSQVMSNSINLLNNIIEEFINQSNDIFVITKEIVFPILKLVELDIALSININSYNPRLIIYLSLLLNFGLKNKDNKNQYNKQISQFYPESNPKSIQLKDFLLEKISQMLSDLSDNLKNDINYDILFKDIYTNLHDNYACDEVKKYFSNFIEEYNKTIQRVNLKKKIPMNYLVIKRKPIPCLEPDYDLSFLGDYPEYVNKEEKNKKMSNILKHKTKNTEKQAIRKLKKEARVIDVERQKVIEKQKIIDLKEKKENNLENKAIKETNESEIDYEMNDDELNSLEYEKALKYDKRTFFQYYWSLLKKEQLILFTFLPTNDYNLVSLKLALFVVSLSLEITINGFFFTDETMHQIHQNEGEFDLLYQIPQILYSTIISDIINYVLQKLALSEDSLLTLKKIKNFDKAKKQYESIYRCLKIKFVVFIIISFLLIFFCWYYISSFCAVYVNTQSILFKDTLIGLLLSMSYPFGLCLLPGLCRIPALQAEKKDKKCLYKFSGFVEII